MNLRKNHYRYPFRTPCELAPQFLVAGRGEPRPSLGARLASACSLPHPLRAGWGRVGMRPSVRARVVREGVAVVASRGWLPALRPTPPCARVPRRAALRGRHLCVARAPRTPHNPKDDTRRLSWPARAKFVLSNSRRGRLVSRSLVKPLRRNRRGVSRARSGGPFTFVTRPAPRPQPQPMDHARITHRRRAGFVQRARRRGCNVRSLGYDKTATFPKLYYVCVATLHGRARGGPPPRL